MRRAFVIGWVLLAILAGVAIGVGAYHAGVNAGIDQAATADKIVRVVGPERAYFPFGFFLFPLFFIGFILLARGLWWRGRWGGPGHHGGWGHGEWPKDGPAGRFEEWHRRQHDQSTGDHPGAGGEPAKV